MKYTVLLLRPDYVADGFGQDTYLAHVTARSPKGAIASARKQVWKADDIDDVTSEDYYPLITLEGCHDDLTPRS